MWIVLPRRVLRRAVVSHNYQRRRSSVSAIHSRPGQRPQPAQFHRYIISTHWGYRARSFRGGRGAAGGGLAAVHLEIGHAAGRPALPASCVNHCSAGGRVGRAGFFKQKYQMEIRFISLHQFALASKSSFPFCLWEDEYVDMIMKCKARKYWPTVSMFLCSARLMGVSVPPLPAG